MAKIDLATAKLHLRVDDGTEEDALIEAWIKAAYRAVEGKIFCRVLDEAPPDPAGPDDVVPNGPAKGQVWAWDDINTAVLFILGHLYKHREAVTEGSMAAVPMGPDWLLVPYINFDGGA